MKIRDWELTNQKKSGMYILTLTYLCKRLRQQFRKYCKYLCNHQVNSNIYIFFDLFMIITMSKNVRLIIIFGLFHKPIQYFNKIINKNTQKPHILIKSSGRRLV
ncbi:hypothetical protein pb186bvf_002848 [Paramecium bursaria]